MGEAIVVAVMEGAMDKLLMICLIGFPACRTSPVMQMYNGSS